MNHWEEKKDGKTNLEYLKMANFMGFVIQAINSLMFCYIYKSFPLFYYFFFFFLYLTKSIYWLNWPGLIVLIFYRVTVYLYILRDNTIISILDPQYLTECIAYAADTITL